MKIIITKELEYEASNYATASKSFTSNRHDFHEGGLSAKQRKMFEGKLGEKAIKQFFINNRILFTEDKTSYDEEDIYDFTVTSVDGQILTIDVKTRTKNFHVRTLEMVEQIKKNPKDIYISVRLFDTVPYEVEIIGFATKEYFLDKNRIENLGYLDNYVLLDKELTDVSELIDKLKKYEK